MTKTILIRGLFLGATAAALGGCYGGYDEPTAPTAYGYGHESAYPGYDRYYYGPYDGYYDGQEGPSDLAPRGGKGF